MAAAGGQNGADGGATMKQTAGYFIVEASAMPEIFRKVAEAKRKLGIQD